MTNLPSLSTTGFIIILFAIGGYAQQAAMATNTSGKPFFQSVTLQAGAKQKMDFSIRLLSSVTGRVFADAELNSAPGVDPQGIKGVRLSLRSRDPGFENWVLEQFTDETGTYEFPGLRPGKYTIVIDPADLPAMPTDPPTAKRIINVKPLESSQPDTSAVQRSLTGIVFVDTDGDGRYKQGKDTPIRGALVTGAGILAVSDDKGVYTLSGLPEGRIGLLIRSPKNAENTHVVLDLASGPVTNRVVNVSLTR